MALLDNILGGATYKQLIHYRSTLCQVLCSLFGLGVIPLTHFSCQYLPTNFNAASRFPLEKVESWLDVDKYLSVTSRPSSNEGSVLERATLPDLMNFRRYICEVCCPVFIQMLSP